jgi:class 3 adenylate cyclase
MLAAVTIDSESAHTRLAHIAKRHRRPGIAFEPWLGWQLFALTNSHNATMPANLTAAQAFFLKKPITSRRITAPITASKIAASIPPTITNPILGNRQPAMIDPTIPTGIADIMMAVGRVLKNGPETTQLATTKRPAFKSSRVDKLAVAECFIGQPRLDLMAETRKIAAILAADVVGFSRLTGADEDRTLARLRALRSDLIDPTIAVHKGRVVKRTGDGTLVEFRSVVDAVRCAIEVQNSMSERNAGLAPERRIEFRIGIHLGDIVEESDGDLMGDGVNIAARLEGVAKPGAICLSEDAYR